MRNKLLILVAGLMTLAPAVASAARRVVVVSRPYYSGYYGAYYRPFWGSYWGPSYGAYYVPPNSGEIKLDTKVKDAGVYINGAYAGTTHQNKSMRLRPGSYNIEIRAAGLPRYAERVYVVAGKTLHLRPEF